MERFTEPMRRALPGQSPESDRNFGQGEGREPSSRTRQLDTDVCGEGGQQRSGGNSASQSSGRGRGQLPEFDGSSRPGQVRESASRASVHDIPLSLALPQQILMW